MKLLKKIFKKKPIEYTVGSQNQIPRDNWVKEQLLKLPAGLKILDAGAGEQAYKPFCSHLKYESQDFCQYTGTGNSAGLQTQTWDTSKIDIVSDILNIPRPDASYDVILCTEVFEHIPYPALAVKEFSRLLKPSGILIATAPFCSLTHFAPYHFATGFNKYWYETACKDHGFELTHVSTNGNYFEYLAQELRRLSSVHQTYAAHVQFPVPTSSIQELLAYLQKLSEGDKNSSEFLCFGYHIVAKKL